jgi:ABC-type transport system involved in multi-copper enzyme maturation permease subunit
MTTRTVNLFWREFRELRAATIAAIFVSLAIPLCEVFRDVNDAFFGIYPVLWFYPFAASVFFGMRAAAGEQSNRTAIFAATLPVSHPLLGAVRLLSSLVATAVPLLALFVLGVVLGAFTDQQTKESVLPLAVSVAGSTLVTMCCLAVVAAAGIGQPSEVRAGAVGLGAMFVVGILGWLIFFSVFSFLIWLSSFVAYRRPDEFEFVTVVSIMLGLGSILFAAWFIIRYSRALEPLVRHGANSSSQIAWIPTTIPAPVVGLLWKCMREIGSLGLYTFVGAAALSLGVGALESLGNDSDAFFRIDMRTLPGFLWFGGFLLAILIGIGSAIADLQPGANTFWRSRPISPHAWYWTKYLIGLATILLAIEIPFILSPHTKLVVNLEDLMWWPLVWNVTFSFALTFTCLIRQPAQAAVLAVGAVGILYAAVQAAFGSFTPGEPSAPMVALAPIFIAAFVISTITGYFAAVRDLAIS